MTPSPIVNSSNPSDGIAQNPLSSIVTLSLFHFKGLVKKYWAFTHNGLAKPHFKQDPNLNFLKMLGTGANNGFSLKGNLSTWGILAAWKDEQSAQDFFLNAPIAKQYYQKSDEGITLFHRVIHAKGEWDGASRFSPHTQVNQSPNPLAVITRGRVKFKYLKNFWTSVPQASKYISSMPGLKYAIGVGEIPLVLQATYTLWDGKEAMNAYAYKNNDHVQMIKKTRDLNWYQEDLFMRMEPYAQLGSWKNLSLNLPMLSDSVTC